MRILFFHPDLGIGGAERLIVDCGQYQRKLTTSFTSQFDC